MIFNGNNQMHVKIISSIAPTRNMLGLFCCIFNWTFNQWSINIDLHNFLYLLQFFFYCSLVSCKHCQFIVCNVQIQPTPIFFFVSLFVLTSCCCFFFDYQKHFNMYLVVVVGNSLLFFFNSFLQSPSIILLVKSERKCK